MGKKDENGYYSNEDWMDESGRQFTPEGWKQWVENVNKKQEERIEALENHIDNLQTELDNLYEWCKAAGIKMPIYSAVAELKGQGKRGWFNK